MEECSATAARLEPVGRISRSRNPPLRRRGNKTAEYASLFRPTRSASVPWLGRAKAGNSFADHPRISRSLSSGRPLRAGPVGSNRATASSSRRVAPRPADKIDHGAAVIELEREPGDRPDAVFLDRLDKNDACRFRTGRRKMSSAFPDAPLKEMLPNGVPVAIGLPRIFVAIGLASSLATAIS